LLHRREKGQPANLYAHRSGQGLTASRTQGNEMATANYLPEVLETTEADRLATAFIFTEGPLWHPDGFWYFVDLRRNHLHRLVPGREPELVRTTIGGNGTTFDLQGRLIVCEGDDRRLTRRRNWIGDHSPDPALVPVRRPLRCQAG
jgi:gluconolactonase